MSALQAEFEAKYQRSADDPSSAEMLAIFADGWNAATERAAKKVEAVGPNEGPLALVTAGFAAAIRARTGGEQT